MECEVHPGFSPTGEHHLQLSRDPRGTSAKLALHTDVNKSTGVDGVSPRMLRLAAPAIAGSLTLLFNASLECGSIPTGKHHPCAQKGHCDFYKRSFEYMGVKDWNSLPQNLRDLESSRVFKRAIRRHHL